MQTLRAALAGFLAAVVVVGLPGDAGALRLVTYNILNYSAGREDLMREVLGEIQPDVVVVQEILSQSAVNRFRDLVLDPLASGDWSAARFSNGADTDNALFFRESRVDTISHFVVGTTLRDIDEWTIRPAGYSSSEADLRLYVLHLKASQGSTNEQRRLGEVTAMRARMETFPAGQSYVVIGDFNIYWSTEPAYQFMTNAANGSAGVVIDPIGREGNWHNNSAFADIHTQSTRVTQFGGGASGGMDDRFDMILVGPGLLDAEGFDADESTYDALGQDGNHFNVALNQAPFVEVDSVLAQTLHDASDHLPVWLDLEIPAIAFVDLALHVGTVIVGGSRSADVAVANGALPPADELDYSFTAPAGFTAPSGTFEVEPVAPANLHAIGLDAASVGAFAGDLQVTTDAPDSPLAFVALTGTVVDHAAPSTQGGTVVLAATADLGSVSEGGHAFGSVEAHNVDAGPLRALLEIHAFDLAGDPGFSFSDGFTPATVGATPASWAVEFDADGAEEGVHQAALTLFTRDQQDLSGAVNLAALTWDLRATVSGVGVDAPQVALPSRTGILTVSPNPTRTSTVVELGLRTAGAADLTIYDVTGRAVVTLASRTFGAGTHRLVWEGRDTRGAGLGPGIYFARFVTGTTVDVRKIVRVR